MGNSYDKISQRKSFKNGHSVDDKSRIKPQLSDSQKVIIRSTWRILKQHVSNIGVTTFMSLFEEKSDLKEVFTKFRGKDLTELHTSGLIRVHALRVMATFEKCTMQMDDPSSFATILKEIGEHHRMYNVTSYHVQNLLPFFIKSIKPHLEDQWSDEVEGAWTTMFELMLYQMMKSMEPGNKQEL